MSEADKTPEPVPETSGPDEQSKALTRRQFLVGAAAGAVATGAVAVGYIAVAPPKQVEVTKEVVKEVPVPAVANPAAAPLPTGMRAVKLKINGGEQSLLVEPRWTLNYILREKFGLTGTKTGCNRQMCGMCTILANGRQIYSCTALAVDFEGQEILTVEGLAQNGKLHPVQQAFIDYNAFQCAWCTPGFIMSAVALLKNNRNPSLEDTKHALSGNLCRCGTYQEVFMAVQAAAKAMA